MQNIAHIKNIIIPLIYRMSGAALKSLQIIMLRTTKNCPNTYYSAIFNGKTWDVWLVSAATGAKRAKKAKGLRSEESAEEFIEWLKVH